MVKDTADYEESEEQAIEAGKAELARAPWLFNRAVKGQGFFAEMRENDVVHPDYYSVHCVDGNGTKLFLAAWDNYYEKAPTDGVEMNANDLATLIHAYPDMLNLYMACQTPVEEQHMGEVMQGFVEAAERIRIPNAPWDMNLGKLETASLDEMISLGVEGKGIDFGVVMTAFIEKNKVPNLKPQPGHYIVGVSSSGMHCNGFTGARHVLLTPDVEYREEWKSQYKGRFQLNDAPAILEGKTVREALSVPTTDYLVEAALVGQEFDNRDIYGINITGNGLHNFNRVGEGVSFEIVDPLSPHPIHMLLAEESGWDPQKSYTKQNNGMGFAYVVPTLDIAERIVDMVNIRGVNRAKIVGQVKASDEQELRTTLHKPFEGPALDFVGYNG